MGSGAKGGVDPLESFQLDGLRPAAGDHRMMVASDLGDNVEAGQPIAHHGAARSVAKASTIDADVCFCPITAASLPTADIPGGVANLRR